MRLTKRPLFFWILNRCRGLQLFLLLVIVISLFFRVYPLEMQRKIINIAINLKMIDKLYLYCALYFGAVLIAGLLKYFINTLQAVIGQKILIDMREELYQHILQLPLSFFHKTQTGTIISAMTAELNAIATFLGGALAVPITSVLTFAVFLTFMIYLNPTLGLITMCIYPFELVVIPLLQRRYNRFNRQRVATTRQMAGLVNEAVSGIHEVQGNGAYRLEQTKIDRLVRHLYELIVKLSIVKYGIKFSNNLFQSLGPFLLFLIGGWLAIHGEFTIGALVAFLSAYEKVYDPWKEIIEYYQNFQDASVRYKQIMELFHLDIEPVLAVQDGPCRRFQGEIKATDLNYFVNNSIQLLNDINFTLPAGHHLALIGFSGSGKSTLALVVSQLFRADSGSITIDGHEIGALSKIEIAANISSVSQHSFIFTGTVRDNLLYASHALQLLGTSAPSLPDPREIIDLVKEIGLAEDIIRWGLRSIIPPQRAEPMIPSFLRMRSIIQTKLRDEFPHAVEFYHADLFLNYSSLAVNIMFGTYGVAHATKKLLTNLEFRDFLVKIGLEKPLIELGLSIAEATITFLGDFHDDEFFFQGSPMSSAQFHHYEALIKKARKTTVHGLEQKEQDRVLLLALTFTPGLHKIITITQSLKDDILAARRRFLETIADVDLETCTNGAIQTTIAPYQPHGSTASRTTSFIPFCINQYISSHSLGDNLIFGTVIDRDLIRDRVGALALKEFEQHGLLDEIMEIGLDFHVGSKGDNLSGGQKQKIALARSLLKKNPVLILDEATASLDNNAQAQIQRYLTTTLRGNTTVMAVVHRLDMISEYDHILVMKEGRIAESGSYNELMAKKGILHELISKE